jgi:hypothetical protein
MTKSKKMICKLCQKEYSAFFIGKHIKYSHNIPPEIYYIDYLKKEKKYCKECGKPTKFKSIPTGFRDFCSGKCLKNHIKTNENFKKANQEKTENAILEKYGVKNVYQTDWCKNKIKNTIENKYGGIGMASSVIKEKIESTNIKKYGHKNVFSNKKIIKKITKNRNYNSILEKTKNTTKSKYGVDCVFKLKSIRNKNTEFTRNEIIQDIFNGNRLRGKVTPLFEKNEYLNVKTDYKWKCNACQCEFIDNLDDGKLPRCPICFPYTYSKEELEILNYIKSIIPHEEIITKDRKILNGQEIDIYIPNKKIAIEYNGMYWHTELSGGKDKNYHLNKTIECEKQNIQLIHICDDEWKNKKQIICNKLKSLLKANNPINKIYARMCEIKNTTKNETKTFLNQYHIQGNDKSIIKIGLYYKNELVAVMTFGKLRIALGSKNKTNTYELYRYASVGYIVGGASKLLNYFIKTYNPEKIISYADKRYSIGNLYEKIGFKKIKTTPPNYWYTKNYTKKLHRFQFRKNNLNKKLSNFNPHISEWENMKNNGYDRIWDCGNILYEWNKII